MAFNSGASPSAFASEKQFELLPRFDNSPRSRRSSSPRPNRLPDKKPTTSSTRVNCLDGLRGIACLAVFNYHFFWPWTPFIMLGYGAMLPGAVESPTSWLSKPIICLLYRGRPMVAIFFAMSGYVLCRHIVKSIHDRQLDTVYRKLSSAVFRRGFRLYIPPTLSMLLVAVLAQMGAFRTQTEIFTGLDSVYINGTAVVLGHAIYHEINGTVDRSVNRCPPNTYDIKGMAGVAEHIGMESLSYLGDAADWPDRFCVRNKTQSVGAIKLYTLGDNEVPMLQMKKPAIVYPKLTINNHLLPVENWTEITDFSLVRFGGSWEEHPLIYNTTAYAIHNFTRQYSEWANPFNFNHYHPTYDPHTYTIPIELRGSMVLYLFLLATAAFKSKWRLLMASLLSAYSLSMGRWDTGTFLGGMILSEIDMLNWFPPAPTRRWTFRPVLRYFVLIIALFLLSYPDVGPEYTPGFRRLSKYVPKYYAPLSGWMFYHSIGALLLLPCILRSQLIQQFLESDLVQYFGKISFSFYLLHGPVLHGLGFWIMPRLFEAYGRTIGYFYGWIVLLGITLVLSHYWYKKIDIWSAAVGKRIERVLLIE